MRFGLKSRFCEPTWRLRVLPKLLNASDRCEFCVVSEFWTDVCPIQEPSHDRFRAVGDIQVPTSEPMQYALKTRFCFELEDLLKNVKHGRIDLFSQ